MAALTFVVSLLMGYVTALLFAWTLKKYNVGSFYQFFLFAISILSLPLLLPSDEKLLRVLLGINSAIYTFKMWDLYRDRKRGPLPEISELNDYLRASTNLVRRRMKHEKRLADSANFLNFLKAFGLAFVGAASMTTLCVLDLQSLGFWPEHFLKMMAFYFCIDGGMRLISSTQRILLGWSREMTQNPIFAYSPADFWRRYNRSIGQYFFEHIFRPMRGTRRPMLATLAVFFVSSVLHEYIFGIALMELQLFQTAFFMIQGVAVAASQRWKPSPKWRIVGIVATFLFNVITLSLFFASGHQVFEYQFYDSPTPFDAYFPGP
ncbi:MAG: hypothetical protein P1V97_17455 [Planctomycetota bacterium]|nr:hypothetical protein [Planctomycetota bacterium]